MNPITPTDNSSYASALDQAQQSIINGPAPAPSAVAAPTAPRPAAPQPSWWQKLLPTAGGVLGAIFGLPGDILSGGAASVAGAAGGAALGQGLENSLTGKNPIAANDLTSGVENGLGDLVGLGAGKVVGALGEGLASAGAKNATKLATENADATATKGAIDNATATKLNYGGISDKIQSSLDLGKSQQFVNSMGFDSTNPYEMQKVGQAAGELNNVYDHALQAAPQVNMSDFNKSILDSMRASGAKDLTSANSPVSGALADFTKKTGLDISPQMDAVNVRQLQQAVGRQIGNQENIINNAVLNGNYNAEAENQLRTLQDLYSQLGDKIKTPEVNQAIANSTISDADRQGLVAKYGDKLGNNVADTIGNAKNADDLLGPLQQFTKMNKASQMAIDDIENVTASPRALARAKFEASGGVAIPSKIGGDPTVLDAIESGAKATGLPGHQIVSAANKLHQAGVLPAVAKGMGTVLSKTSKLIPPATTALANTPNIAAASSSAIPLSPAAEMQPGQTGGSPVAPTNPLYQTYDTLLAQEQAAPTVLGPQFASTLGGLAPLIQRNQLASDTVSNLAPTFANAGGAQGFGGGLLNSIIGKLVPGSSQATYLREQTAAAAQLAAVLGIPISQAMALVPSMMSNQNVAGQQQAGVSSLLNTLTPNMVGAQ